MTKPKPNQAKSNLHEVDPEPLSATEAVEEVPTVSGGKPHHLVREQAFPRFFGFVRQIQRYSSYGFLGFLSMHACSVVVAPVISPSLGDSSIQVARELYQTPLIEPWLVYGSALVHLSSGLALATRRLYYSWKHYGKFPKVQPVQISGYLLIPFLFIHTATVRNLPYKLLGDSSLINLSFIAHGFHKYPIISWIGYIGLVFFGANHVFWGIKKWFGLYSKRWSTILRIGRLGSIALGLISLFGISKLPLATGWIATQYQQVFDAVMNGDFLYSIIS